MLLNQTCASFHQLPNPYKKVKSFPKKMQSQWFLNVIMLLYNWLLRTVLFIQVLFTSQWCRMPSAQCLGWGWRCWPPPWAPWAWPWTPGSGSTAPGSWPPPAQWRARVQSEEIMKQLYLWDMQYWDCIQEMWRPCFRVFSLHHLCCFPDFINWPESDFQFDCLSNKYLQHLPKIHLT